MGTNDYLKAIRRRWRVIAISILVALVLGGLFLVVRGEVREQYSAMTVLLNTGQISDPGSTSALNMETLAELVRIGEVPERVADETGYGSAQELAGMVTADGDTTTGLLKITVTAPDPKEASVLSQSFADQLLASLKDRQNRIAGNLRKEINDLNVQAADIRSQLTAADQKNQTEISFLQAQLAAVLLQSTATQAEYSRTISGGSGLDIVQHPVAERASLSPVRIPTSPAGVMVLAFVVGLVAGIAIALVIERLDPKIRTKEAAERAYGYPVLAEIPSMSAARRRGPTLDGSESATTDAFRLLGSGLLPRSERRFDRSRAPGQNGSTSKGRGHRADDAKRGTAIMVTSADAGEGKTTIVANLAAVYAEIGKRVLILSCDFRRPAIHQLLGVSEGPGMTQAVAASNGRPMLEGHIRETRLDHVSIVTTGAGRGGTFRPAASDRLSRAIDEARSYADVVLVDSAPVLVGSEAPELVASADSVLIVVRAGKSNPELAGRAAEVLRRLDAPVVGLALNASREAVVPHAYYRANRHDAVKV